jgi:hypothetical protein
MHAGTTKQEKNNRKQGSTDEQDTEPVDMTEDTAKVVIPKKGPHSVPQTTIWENFR